MRVLCLVNNRKAAFLLVTVDLVWTLLSVIVTLTAATQEFSDYTLRLDVYRGAPIDPFVLFTEILRSLVVLVSVGLVPWLYLFLYNYGTRYKVLPLAYHAKNVTLAGMEVGMWLLSSSVRINYGFYQRIDFGSATSLSIAAVAVYALASLAVREYTKNVTWYEDKARAIKEAKDLQFAIAAAEEEETKKRKRRRPRKDRERKRR